MINNALNINECITELQCIDDYNNDIKNIEVVLSKHIEAIKQNKEGLEEDLRKTLRLMIMKNTKQKDTIYRVMNSLNKIGYY